MTCAWNKLVLQPGFRAAKGWFLKRFHSCLTNLPHATWWNQPKLMLHCQWLVCKYCQYGIAPGRYLWSADRYHLKSVLFAREKFSSASSMTIYNLNTRVLPESLDLPFAIDNRQSVSKEKSAMLNPDCINKYIELVFVCFLEIWSKLGEQWSMIYRQWALVLANVWDQYG